MEMWILFGKFRWASEWHPCLVGTDRQKLVEYGRNKLSSSDYTAAAIVSAVVNVFESERLFKRAPELMTERAVNGDGSITDQPTDDPQPAQEGA